MAGNFVAFCEGEADGEAASSAQPVSASTASFAVASATRRSLSSSSDFSAFRDTSEVKIVNCSEMDVAVGLAVKDSLGNIDNDGYRCMPGLCNHSYGFHGDNGCKFAGSVKAGDDWSTWAIGDIIGCGFNFNSKSIFYTRNGRLLGVAFQNITDKMLSPVIGFSDHSNSY
jgi:hypothetical protein